MNVKVVTDSTADLPADLAEQLGVTVVPAYVHFGKEIFRDRVDITEDELYRRLLHGPRQPTTQPPTPQDFGRAYEALSRQADGIISIHISGKLSATCNSARRARALLPPKYPIQVIDSQSVTMGLGLLVKAAAGLAQSGAGLDAIAEQASGDISRIHLLGLMDTLKFLARGGRIGRAKAMLGSMLSLKPLLTMRNGELEPAGRVRSRAAGLDALADFVRAAPDIRELAIVHNTAAAEARDLARHIAPTFDPARIIVARLGPVLGVHAGPGILFVAVYSGKNS